MGSGSRAQTRARQRELNDVGIVIVDREQDRAPRRVVVGLPQEEERRALANIEKGRLLGVGGDRGDYDARAGECDPAAIAKELVKRAAGKRFEALKIVRLGE